MNAMQKELIALFASQGKIKEEATEQVINGFMFAAATGLSANSAYIGSTESPAGVAIPNLCAELSEAEEEADDLNDDTDNLDHEDDDESRYEVMAVRWFEEKLYLHPIVEGVIDVDYITVTTAIDASGL